MENQDKDLITRDEIIRHVDILVKEHKSTYDRRLLPLVYEFFIRSAEKFHWDRETFFTKYINFSKNTKSIRFTEMEEEIWGLATKEEILINNTFLNKLKEGKDYDKLIATFNHECLHQVDYQKVVIENGRYEEQEMVIMEGLYKIENGKYKNPYIHTLLDELANTCAEYIISSSEPMKKTMPVYLNTTGYYKCKYAFSIMCATLDISEIEMAYLKGIGRKYFDKYLKTKYPQLDIDIIVECFEISLNSIFNKSQENRADETDYLVGINKSYKALLNVANEVIYKRICNAFIYKNDIEETVERLIFDVYKIIELLRIINRKGNISNENLSNQLNIAERQIYQIGLYRKFAYNKNQYPIEIMNSIIQGAEEGKIKEELIEKDFLWGYKNKDYNIKEIVDKYYMSLEDPNDNTQLIEQLKKGFMKFSIRAKNELKR